MRSKFKLLRGFSRIFHACFLLKGAAISAPCDARCDLCITTFGVAESLLSGRCKLAQDM